MKHDSLILEKSMQSLDILVKLTKYLNLQIVVGTGKLGNYLQVSLKGIVYVVHV